MWDAEIEQVGTCFFYSLVFIGIRSKVTFDFQGDRVYGVTD